MPQVHREISSSRHVDAIWATIGDFYAIHTWCPWVDDTARDLSRPNTRIVTMGDSQAAEEVIEVRPGLMRYRVIDQSMMRNYEAVLAVVPDPGGKGSLITWDASFDCDEALAQPLTEAIGTSFEKGLAAVDQSITRVLG